MAVFDQAFIDNELSKQTSIFGLKLWVVIGVFVGAAVVLILFSISLCLTTRRRNTYDHSGKHANANTNTPPPADGILQHHHRDVAAVPEIRIEMGGRPDHRVVFSPSAGSQGTGGDGKGINSSSFGEVTTSGGCGNNVPEVSHLGWGRWYTLRELELATNGLADENVVGEGGYGIVYSGVLADNTKVAVKNLLNNRGQAEKEFKVEVDAIGRVGHKNLVRLLGYCVEGAYRMLVYEYVNNGNLDQWLHGDVGDVSPLTWEIRLNIILGTAKGLANLHEGLEPRVVHRDVKSSNILLDRQWNPKVSDFGLAKLMYSESSYISTRVMGTFGYVAPEYACTGMLNEKSDVYSFGILVMEIISGRAPVDYNRPKEEVNLVDWLKAMVGDRKSDQVVDPKLPKLPSSKALKRLLLVALKCVDPDARKRVKCSTCSKLTTFSLLMIVGPLGSLRAPRAVINLQLYRPKQISCKDRTEVFKRLGETGFIRVSIVHGHHHCQTDSSSSVISFKLHLGWAAAKRFFGPCNCTDQPYKCQY